MMLAGAIWLMAAQPADPGASLQAALQCRAVADDAARLRCYDEAIARLTEIAGDGRLVLADPREVRPPPPRRVDSRVRQARESGYNRWVLELEDGSVWRTIENSSNQLLPRPGQRVRIERGSLGYFLKIENRPQLRAARVLD